MRNIDADMATSNQREAEFIKDWKDKSKFAGDSNWRKVNGWVGEGDYINGQDDGENRERV